MVLEFISLFIESAVWSCPKPALGNDRIHKRRTVKGEKYFKMNFMLELLSFDTKVKVGFLSAFHK
jgi:hypothetical protein